MRAKFCYAKEELSLARASGHCLLATWSSRNLVQVCCQPNLHQVPPVRSRVPVVWTYLPVVWSYIPTVWSFVHQHSNDRDVSSTGNQLVPFMVQEELPSQHDQHADVCR